MTKNKTKEHIPVLITLMGDKGIGKSHYLFALGLALQQRLRNNNLVFRNRWKVTQLDDTYAKQLDDWKTQYQTEQTISTPTGSLSFEVCNEKRCYKVICDNLFELSSTDLTDNLKLNLRRSSSTLLMFDARALQTQSDFQPKWESLLRQDDFQDALSQSLGNVVFDMPLRVCFTHAEIFDHVKRALQNGATLESENDPGYAEQTFETYPQFSEIRKLLRQNITKYYYYNSAVLVEERRFNYYNLISPILDTLDDMETIFNMKTNFWSPNQVKWYQSVCGEIERQKKAIDAQQAKNIEFIETERAFLVERSQEISSQTTYLENIRNNLINKKEEIERQKKAIDAQKVSLVGSSQELQRQKDKFERKKTAYDNERAFLKEERKKLRFCCSMIKLIFFIGAIGTILYALLAQAAF